MQLFDLSGEIAVVIGGTGALGGAMARALAEHGARIAILGRNAENGAARVADIETIGASAQFFAADASSRSDLERAREEITAACGDSPRILINAAGGNRADATLAPGADFCDLPLDAWREVFDLNLVGGALLPAQVFGAAMREGGGSIINIASMSGLIPLSRVVAYGASKAAVLNLTQFLAREWAPFGIRVNAISPGFFPAEQNRALLFNADGSYSARGAQIIAHTPMARFGAPDELGGAAVFLASRRASGFLTGHNLVVDGGFSAMTI